MSAKKKLIIAIAGGAIFLAVVVASLWNLIFGGVTNQIGKGNLNQPDLAEGQMVYQTHTVFAQEPVSLNGVAQLQSDNSYFYDAALGEIETVYVKDGQYVKKGDILYAYFQDKNKYDLEDALREQTRLYNQREELIAQLREETGGVYNYQGDLISTYWTEDGKQQYYVVEAIGKSNASAQSSDEEGGAPTGGGTKEQIRQVNRQIEDIEIKLIRLKEQQHGQVKAKFAGKVVLDEAGRDNNQVPLVRIISNEVAVEGSVSEYEFYVLGTSRPARLFVNAEERELKGEMVEYDAIPAPSANTQSSNAPASPSGGETSGARYRYKIAPEEFIQPGFSVKVQIDLPGFVIPKEAILEENGKNYVFVVRDQIAHKTEIKLERQGIQQVALQHVAAGDVLLMNPFDVKDGQVVAVAEMSPNFEGEADMPGMPKEGGQGE
ncbi:MAG: biotin/lipoyl-binding protein [Aerococcaceae bacterium]|nr:biotin/lipoyl-binding protein [Aerococcaceae bacterium]